MSYRKAKIDWCDYTFNPVSGCHHGCDYCYARKITKRFPHAYPFGFEPTFYGQRLSTKAPKEPSVVFVSSMGDLFGSWRWWYFNPDSPLNQTTLQPNDVLNAVFDHCRQNPQHTYVFLTKAPGSLRAKIFPKNSWVGVSAATEEEYIKRTKGSGGINLSDHLPLRFVSLEPLREFVEIGSQPSMKSLDKLEWFIIGAMTGGGAKNPPIEAFEKTILSAKAYDKPVFVKDNVYSLYPELKDRVGYLREYPQ